MAALASAYGPAVRAELSPSQGAATIARVSLSTSSRLFLGSSGLGGLATWLATLSAPRRALLIPTAARPMTFAPFVEASAAALESLGLEVAELNLDEVGTDEALRLLDAVDLVFFTGGYALYLLEHIRRTELAAALIARVNAGDLAYVGISAGAAMAGPDLAPLSDPSDPGVVDTTEGLHLVPFVVLAHRNRGRTEHHNQLVAAYSDRLSFVSLTDSQAVVVENGRWEIRPSR